MLTDQCSARVAASEAEELYRVLAKMLNNIVPHDYLSLMFAATGSANLHEYSLSATAHPVLTEGPIWSMTNTLSGRACTTRQAMISTHSPQDRQLADVAY